MATLAANAAAVLRRAWALRLTAKARLARQGFVCAALAGRSGMNLVVNSDLAVTCSCHDVDGTGRLGDLKTHSLSEILDGPTARRFRDTLSAGRLPTPLCARCCDLDMAPRAEAADRNGRPQPPAFFAVENTSACSLRCTSCPRDWIARQRTRRAMSLDDVARVADELRRLGVRAVGFLNYGEPFLSPRIGRELEIIRSAIPAVRLHTSTVGVFLDDDERRQAALLLDRMQFSLDGPDQRTAERYQRGIDFARAYANMKALVAYRDARGLAEPVIVWKYLLFNWNDRPAQIGRAIELARAAGVDQLLFERTVSPFYGLSWRYYLGRLNGLGRPCPTGLCVDFRPPAPAAATPA